MRIGIDGRMYSESGVGRYIRNLIYELQILDKQNEYFIFLLKKDFDNIEFVNQNFQKELADFKWYGLEEQIKFPKLLNKYSLNLMHFPHFNVPAFYNGKFVVTIHDLIHQNFSMQRTTTHGAILYKIKQFGYNKVFKNAIKKSSKILVPSNFVRDQLENKWKVNAKKIEVTYEAVEGQLIAIATHCDQTKIQQTLKKFGIRGSFIFYAGNAHPHKNVEGLIVAYQQLKLKNQKSKVKINDIQLVLAGQDHYFWQRIKKEMMDLRFRGDDQEEGGDDNWVEDVIFTGFVTDEDLVCLYKSAQVFVMPSFEEGFGIPILEAMACGISVISSNEGSLPEVGGNACLYFDPHNIDDMVEKISKVLSDEKLKKQLIKKGNLRYKQFSWKKLAAKTLRTYNPP